MKTLSLTFCCLFFLGASTIVAQEKKNVPVYRRSSLYTIQIIDKKLEGAAKKAVDSTFLSMPIPDKYNDHNLSERTLNLEEYTASPEEIKKIAEELNSKKKGVGGLLNKVSKTTEKATGTPSANKEATDIAQILKFFEKKNIANRLVAKWYNCTPNSTTCDYSLIAERGLASASTEEIKAADKTLRGRDKIKDNAAAELIPRTFVMATKYSYLSADEILEIISAAATQVASSGITGALLGSNAQLVSLGTAVASKALAMALDGYFVKTSTYLFQLEWDKETQKLFEEKYWNSPVALFKSTDFKLKYVGKTWDYAPATIKISTHNDNDNKIIARATVRATDSSIKELQQKYEVFKTLAPIHIEGDQIVAHIGTKEGVKNGSKFDILEIVMNEDGTTEYKKVGTTSPIKDKVWDNVYGAGIVFEGEAKNENLKADEGKKSKKEESKTSQQERINLGRTYFQGNPKKLYEGLVLRQTK